MLQCLVNYYECLGNFVPNVNEVGRQQCSLRVDDDVCVNASWNSMQSHGFPQSPLHAITLNGPTKRFADCEPHA